MGLLWVGEWALYGITQSYNSIPMNTKPNQALREAELNLLIPVTTINCLYLVEYCFESEEK